MIENIIVHNPESSSNISCGKMFFIAPLTFHYETVKMQKLKNRAANKETIRFSCDEINEAEGLKTELTLYID